MTTDAFPRTYDAALNTLLRLIDRGAEFPDAAFKAATLHRLDQKKIEAMYDNATDDQIEAQRKIAGCI